MRRQPWDYASVISIVGDQKESLLGGSIRDPLLESIHRTVRDLAQCEEDILSSVARIETDLEALKANLSVGNHINELGILQREPVNLDMLAAKRQMLIDQLKTLLWIKKEGS